MAGKAVAVTVEEFEEYERQRGNGPRGEEPNRLSRWLRTQARGVLETRLNEHKNTVPALADLFNHKAEGKRLHSLFDKVVNGIGAEADRAALTVLATYKLGLLRPV
jgi:hypothetical protein